MSVTAPRHKYHENGRFVRPPSTFRKFISMDPLSEFPAERGRYALYASACCPWAHRTMIVRLLKGLEDVVDLYLLENYMGPDGWFFSGQHGSLAEDPLHGFIKLKDLYHKADPKYKGRFTVPLLWDKKTDRPVNNESSEIIRMFYTEFDHLLPKHLRESHRSGGGLYPPSLRREIDKINEWVYETVNNGVYKVGLCETMDARDEAIGPLFSSLDTLEEMLSHGKPYLLGDTLTEVDIRLYPTLIRFDVAYYPVFGCSYKAIRSHYPRLYLWLRRLYWDQDADGPLRAAFWRSTQPHMGYYVLNYAVSVRLVVHGGQGVLDVPPNPVVTIDPLPQDGLP